MEALILGFVLAATYGFLYLSNKDTPLPEGCIEISGGCHSCSDVSCELNTGQEGSNV